MYLQQPDEQREQAPWQQTERRTLPTRGQRTWDRSRDADRARDAQAPLPEDTELAIADLEGRKP